MRTFRWFWLLQAAVLGLAILVHRQVGHATVEAAYEGRSLGALNRVLEGRTSIPLSTYLIEIDALVADLVGLALLVLFLQAVGSLVWSALVWHRRRRDASNGVPGQPRAEERQRTRVRPRTADRAPRRRFVLALASFAAASALALTWYLIRYESYMGVLERPPGAKDRIYVPPQTPGLTPAQLLQVGAAHESGEPRRTSYVHHAPSKPAGTIRIGIFGGAHALGHEAAPGHDVASVVQRRLEEAGATHVEVINFGVIDFGMHQVALMWEYVGSRYELDYTVLMPFAFHVRTDNTFLRTSHEYGPLHGVFVVEDDSLRYRPVLGKDRRDSCRRYFRPFPPLQYWRYDTRPPMLIRPLLRSPHNRRWNPLYYAEDPKGATLQTYRHLLHRMANEAGSLIVLTDEELGSDLRELLEPAPASRPSVGTLSATSDDGLRAPADRDPERRTEESGRASSRIRADRIHVLTSRLEEWQSAGSCLYTAPLDRPSALGYDLMGAELAAYLLGEEHPTHRVLRLRTDRLVTGDPDRTIEPLRLGPAVLSIGDSVVGELRRRRSGDSRWSRLAETVDAAEEGIGSLVASLEGNAPVLIPFAGALREHAPVSIAWTESGETVRAPAGEVVRTHTVIGELVIDWPRLRRWSDSAGSGAPIFHPHEGGEFGVLETASRGRLAELRVEIGDSTLLVGEVREAEGGILPVRVPGILPERVRKLLLGPAWIRTVFRPATSEYVYFRGGEGQYVDVDDLADGAGDVVARAQRGTGAVDLRIEGGAGEARSVPLFVYDLVPVVGPPFASSLGAPIPVPRPE